MKKNDGLTKKLINKLKNLRARLKLPIGVKIALYILPVVITALFYILRESRNVMDWVVSYIVLPIRNFFGLMSSIYPFALMEILCTAAGIFLIYYIIKSIVNSWRRRERWKAMGKRFLPILAIALYIWGIFCWLQSSGYHAAGFAEKHGFSDSGTAYEDLAAVTEFFAKKASELSVQVERDENGSLIFDRRVMFYQSRQIYKNISGEFESLQGRVYAPKPMTFYSWLMSATGYTGMYFALTGESLINTQAHGAFMPATVAHEQAHQLGVFAENEANFVAVLACVTSGNITFEYSGYMVGLSYLSNALSGANYDRWNRIMSGLSDEVKLDRAQNQEFWASKTTVNIGFDFLDSFLSWLLGVSNDVVNTVYDGYLKSQSQELGIMSYGACVDMLVEYFRENPELVS